MATPEPTPVPTQEPYDENSLKDNSYVALVIFAIFIIVLYFSLLNSDFPNYTEIVTFICCVYIIFFGLLTNNEILLNSDVKIFIEVMNIIFGLLFLKVIGKTSYLAFNDTMQPDVFKICTIALLYILCSNISLLVYRFNGNRLDT